MRPKLTTLGLPGSDCDPDSYKAWARLDRFWKRRLGRTIPPPLWAQNLRLPAWKSSTSPYYRLLAIAQLQGSLELYYWALAWSLHRWFPKQMGGRFGLFALNADMLELLGIRHVRDVPESWLDRDAMLISYRCEVTGLCTELHLLGTSPSRKSPLLHAVFGDCPEELPWEQIGERIQWCFMETRKYFRRANVQWNSPPWFEYIRHARELAEDTDLRWRSPRQIMSALQMRRRQTHQEILTVCRCFAPRSGRIVIRFENARTPVAQSKRVRLYGHDEKPTVDGQAVDVLTEAQYNIVQALLQAYPERLSRKDLSKQSGHPAPEKYLRALQKKSESWANVVSFPTGKNGYAIK